MMQHVKYGNHFGNHCKSFGVTSLTLRHNNYSSVFVHLFTCNNIFVAQSTKFHILGGRVVMDVFFFFVTKGFSGKNKEKLWATKK